MTIANDVQRSSVGELVTLFELDASNFTNGSILYFTSTAYSSADVVFNGNTYTAVEIDATGFEYNGQSAFPTPTLRLSNVNQLASALVVAYSDLIGAQVRRVRTFSNYLDTGPTPDAYQTFPVDIYNVEQKTKHTRTEIEWKLSAAIDQQGTMIPSFQLVRDYCNRVYRYYNSETGTVQYGKATCPYSGGYYDINNNPTTNPALDTCPKTLTGCQARFGVGKPLPFKGCPGLARLR